MAAESEKVVNDFCKSWERRNLDEIMGYFTDDAVYHNIPMPPAKGKDAIRERSARSCRWRARSSSRF